jgi:hypothetical protein
MGRCDHLVYQDSGALPHLYETATRSSVSGVHELPAPLADHAESVRLSLVIQREEEEVGGTCEQWITRMFSSVSIPSASRTGRERANWSSDSASSSGVSTALFRPCWWLRVVPSEEERGT